ncbi:hypothetical protein LVQ78_23860 [Buttiauxella sp. A2-C2_NF]|uniref:hypothetical protein n=1 Tax=Buttiauxella ferragutiae TaxID=82989 RepID=UPI001E387332|nr:hypothetical protein [Buttiauxella ferragutiae]MCE0829021.1 hypothetical protein [Buttiauxella ferragutiae]UNK63037.1 hypothetical protein MNO13_08995 [Buttiauxella ferragutiae]
MKHIGFYGGSSIVELGNAEEMFLFLTFLQQSAESLEEIEVITRLFKKYLRLQDLDVMLNFLNKLCGENKNNNYDRYVEGLMHCIISAKGFYEDWNIYKSVKVLPTDMPDFMTERDRPLEDYEHLHVNDQPFWLRHQ